MKPHRGMKSQDIVILLFIHLYFSGSYKVKELGGFLQISQSEISESLNRSQLAGLLDKERKRVHISGFYEFLIYGLKYVFPVVPGRVTRGIATSHSAPPLNEHVVSGNDSYVWPSAGGNIRSCPNITEFSLYF